MNINNNFTKYNFNGKLSITGKLTKKIENAVTNSNIIQKLLSENNDIFIKVKERESSRMEIYLHGRDEILYQVLLKKVRSDKSIFSKINFFLKPMRKLTKNFHSEFTTVEYLSDDTVLQKAFNLSK